MTRLASGPVRCASILMIPRGLFRSLAPPARHLPNVLPVPVRELSALDQTLRLLQVASLYCKKYKRITIKTKDVLGGKPLGEVSAEMDLLVESVEERKITREEFLKRLSTNTFSGETDHALDPNG